jgi:voltage-gated potassium channel
MATVGYGDIVPSSTEGRIFGALIIVMGTVFFSLLTAQLAAYMVGEDEIERDKELLQTLKENQKTLSALQIQNEKRDNAQIEALIIQLSQRLERIEQQLAQPTSMNQPISLTAEHLHEPSK